MIAELTYAGMDAHTVVNTVVHAVHGRCTHASCRVPQPCLVREMSSPPPPRPPTLVLSADAQVGGGTADGRPSVVGVAETQTWPWVSEIRPVVQHIDVYVHRHCARARG